MRASATDLDLEGGYEALTRFETLRGGIREVRAERWVAGYQRVRYRHMAWEEDHTSGSSDVRSTQGGPIAHASRAAGAVAPGLETGAAPPRGEGSAPDVTPPCDDRSRGSGEVPEPLTKGGPSWPN